MFDFSRIDNYICNLEGTPDCFRIKYAFPFLGCQVAVISLDKDFDNFRYNPNDLIFEIKNDKETFRIPGEEIVKFSQDTINFYLVKEWRRNEQGTYN